jgi:hypothetical protein
MRTKAKYKSERDVLAEFNAELRQVFLKHAENLVLVDDAIRDELNVLNLAMSVLYELTEARIHEPKTRIRDALLRLKRDSEVEFL